jgi:hypothetical protein
MDATVPQWYSYKLLLNLHNDTQKQWLPTICILSVKGYRSAVIWGIWSESLLGGFASGSRYIYHGLLDCVWLCFMSICFGSQNPRPVVTWDIIFPVWVTQIHKSNWTALAHISPLLILLLPTSYWEHQSHSQIHITSGTE